MSDDPEQAYVATGGRYTGRHKRLHGDRDCRSLANAVDVREATQGEIDSREWCGTCTGDPDRSGGTKAYYNAAVAAGKEGDA